jgi:putative transposase
MSDMNLRSYSSSVGRLYAHFCFKVKYCHRVFDEAYIKKRCGRTLPVRQRCEELILEVCEEKRIEVHDIGFDRDHVHMILDMTHKYAACDIAKAIKGRTGRLLLREFPEMKKRCFWGSGLWSPAYFFDGVGVRTIAELGDYVRMQGVKDTAVNEEKKVAAKGQQLTMAVFI